ncbi:hypothetical protein BOTBODRAFT_319473 [Botryobasidium botryosum FD-172 SS1]|uniref:Uncharacterized protein n=1 Tax=Botryobasidium botryosum (strain FD-172 SS1) TaxID=930990 RepID=A0A067MYN7_BOTB1|nr:hypothetical protein BOTBODRAFT_319473 [Botryobasidium botryosum FD-172 SS1]
MASESIATRNMGPSRENSSIHALHTPPLPSKGKGNLLPSFAQTFDNPRLRRSPHERALPPISSADHDDHRRSFALPPLQQRIPHIHDSERGGSSSSNNSSNGNNGGGHARDGGSSARQDDSNFTSHNYRSQRPAEQDSSQHSGRLSPSSRSGRKRPYDSVTDSPEDASSAISRSVHPPESNLRHSYARADSGDRADADDSMDEDDIYVKEEQSIEAEPQSFPRGPPPRRLQPSSPIASQRSTPSPRPARRDPAVRIVAPPPQPVASPLDDRTVFDAPATARKRRRVTISGPGHFMRGDAMDPSSSFGNPPLSPAVMGFNIPPEGVEQVRSALSLKHQQKALIEQRKAGVVSSGGIPPFDPSSSRGVRTTLPESSSRATASSAHDDLDDPPPHSSGLDKWPQEAPKSSILDRRRAAQQRPGGASTLTVRTPGYSLVDQPIRSAPPVPQSMRMPTLPSVAGGEGRGRAIERQSYSSQQQSQPGSSSGAAPNTGRRREFPPPTPTGAQHQTSHTRTNTTPSVLAPLPSSSTRRAPLTGPRTGAQQHGITGTPVSRSYPTGGPNGSNVSLNSPTHPPAPATAGPSSFSASVRSHAVPHMGTTSSISTPQVPTFPSHAYQHPTSTSVEHPDKASFMSMFSSFYDSLADAHRLKKWLDDQVRKSSNLYQSLEQSSETFEELVDSKVRQAKEESRREIEDLRKRLELLENKSVSGESHGSAGSGGRQKGDSPIEVDAPTLDPPAKDKRSSHTGSVHSPSRSNVSSNPHSDTRSPRTRTKVLQDERMMVDRPTPTPQKSKPTTSSPNINGVARGERERAEASEIPVAGSSRQPLVLTTSPPTTSSPARTQSPMQRLQKDRA